MAGNIDGYFHDNVLVRGSEMAKITNALAGQRSYVIPGYAQEMNITVSGLNVTVQPGMAVIQGYPVVIKQPMTLSLPANSSGYIVITIDKSQEVTFEGDPNDPGSYTWENNQVALEYVTSLIDGNLANDDAIFTFNLAELTTNGTSVTIKKARKSFRIADVQWTDMVLLDGFSPVANNKPQYCINNGIYYFRGIIAEPGTKRGYFWNFPSSTAPSLSLTYRMNVAQWNGNLNTAYASKIYATNSGLNLVSVESETSSIDLSDLSGKIFYE